jgi:aldehyde dehydrogenase (NAD+)
MDMLLTHPAVAHVSFTGSTPVGREIAGRSGQEGKRVTLELSGSNTMAIFADANLENAVRAATEGVFVGAGQTCARATRLLVQREAHDYVIQALTQRARSIRVGDPLSEQTEMGPLRSAPARAQVADAVQRALDNGATLRAGGASVAPEDALKDGYFYAPTVLDLAGQQQVSDNEIFGPVATIIPFDSEAEAIDTINSSQYGLTCGIWTGDGNRAWRLAKQAQAGVTWINTYRRVHWRVPYGGVKGSGYGRENGAEALHEYGVTKAVMVDFSGVFPDAYGAEADHFNPHFNS